MGGTAWMFAGQGSHFVGVGKFIPQDIRNIILSLYGRKMLEILDEGTEEEIKQSLPAQVGITAYEIGLAREMLRKTKPQLVMGHSLGEYPAACIAGMFSTEATLWLVGKRAEYMEKYAPRGFVIVVKKGKDVVEKFLRLAPIPVYMSNINAPDQTLLATLEENRDRLIKWMGTLGWKWIPLKAAALPFHTPLMEEAAERFEEVLDQVPSSKPDIPIYINSLGKESTSILEIKLGLKTGIAKPVNWPKAVFHLLQKGISQAIEIAPKPVLSKLTKKTAREIPTSVAKPKEATPSASGS